MIFVLKNASVTSWHIWLTWCWKQSYYILLCEDNGLDLTLEIRNDKKTCYRFSLSWQLSDSALYKSRDARWGEGSDLKLKIWENLSSRQLGLWRGWLQLPVQGGSGGRFRGRKVLFALQVCLGPVQSRIQVNNWGGVCHEDSSNRKVSSGNREHQLTKSISTRKGKEGGRRQSTYMYVHTCAP